MSLMKTLTIDGQTYDLSMKNLLDGSAVNSLHTPSTSVSSRGQIVLGEYNIPDLSGNNLSRGDYSLLIGNGTTPPIGWLVCDGSAVSRSTYPQLFAAIGTNWGVGDGSTTFNLPDLRGRTPIGAGTGVANDGTTALTARVLGTKNIGVESVTLTASQSGVPAHAHSYADYNTTYTFTAISKKPGTSTATTTGYSAKAGGGNTSRTSNNNTAANAANAHENMQPSSVVNFIIATGITHN